MTDMSEQNPKLDPARANGAFLVVECDVPAEMTLGEWRRHCAEQRRAAAGEQPRRGLLRRIFGA